MKSVWKVVLIIVVVAVALGAISIGVGIMTGADMSRIYTACDDRYHVGMLIDYIVQVFEAVGAQL